MSNNTESLSLGQEALRHRLAELPQAAVPHIKMGYQVLNRLSEDELTRLLDYVIDSMKNSKDLDSKIAQDFVSLDEHTIGDSLTAISFTVATVTDIDVVPDDFILFAMNELITPSDERVVRSILKCAAETKEQLRTAFDKISVANAVLPSFRSISIETDIRIRFEEDGSLKAVVPLSVILIRTDCDEQVWCQATKDDLEKIAKRIDRAISDLNHAQNFVEARS